MLIDCDTCAVRGTGCADCVVTVLLGAPPARDDGPAVVPLGLPRPPGRDRADEGPGVVVEFDEIERRAVRALADGGLIPPLRHEERHSPVRRDGRRTG